MSRKILGLDIRKNSVSAVLVSKGVKGMAIEAHSHEPAPAGNGFEDRVASALDAILKTMNPSGSVCIASFPADRISYRNLTVPFREKRKIGQILPFELEPTVPFQIDDLILDFQPIRFSGGNHHTPIIAAAAEKEALASFLNTLAAVNINPEIITAGGYSTALCLANCAHTPEMWLLADLDATSGNLFAVASGQIILARTVALGSDPAVRPEALCTHIRQTLAAMEEIIDYDFQPEEVFITGSGVAGVTIEQSIQRALDLPVHRVDLVRDTALLKKAPPAAGWIPEKMDNALALTVIETQGIEGLNFRKTPHAASKHWAENKQGIIRSGVLILCALVLGFFNITLQAYSLEKDLDHLNSRINDIFIQAFPDVKPIVDPLQQMQAKIQELKKASFIGESDQNNNRHIDILYDISSLIPKEIDVDFTMLVIGTDSVQISGDTDTFNAVDDIKNRLEKSPLFKGVTITSANMEKSGNRVRFKLRVQL